MTILDFLRRVIDQQSPDFVVVLISVYVGLKGCAHTLLSQVQLPYYVQRNVEGRTLQLLTGLGAVPWGAKGFIGAISDALPICGYRKRWYMIISGLLGCAGSLCLFTLNEHIRPHRAALLFFCCNLQAATFDLLSEGKYVEMMRRKPNDRADVVSFVWFCVNIGALIAASCVGVIVDHFGTRWVFLLATILMIQSLLPILLNFLPYDQVTQDARSAEYEAHHVKLFFLAGSMGSVAIGYLIVGLTQSTDVLCAYTVSGAILLACLQFLCLNDLIASCNTFMFINEASYISVAGVVDRWYISGKDCVSDGPAFSYSYFQSYTTLVGLIASWVALWLFQRYLSGWGLRRVFCITTLLRVIGSLSDIIIINRWNVTVLGISDKAFFLVGDSIIMPIVTMLNFLPGILLTSRLCPKDLESTTYAVLAGYHNFGGQVSKVLGLKLIDLYDIRTTAPTCQWTGLPQLVFICHAVAPLLALPLVTVLMPSTIPPSAPAPENLPATPPRSIVKPSSSYFETDALLEN